MKIKAFGFITVVFMLSMHGAIANQPRINTELPFNETSSDIFRTMAANWKQKSKITAAPRGVGAQFGYAVAVNENTMVVGAPFDGTTLAQAGAAFVFVLNGDVWTQQAKLVANDGAVADKFGISVAVSGDTIVVGAYQDDNGFQNTGSAYVFVRSGTSWTQQQKITAPDATAADEFGNAVAISGDTVAVGSHFADLPRNSDAGSVYIYRRSGANWQQTQKLVPVAGKSTVLGDYFGESLAMSESKLVVGASGDDTPFTAAGAVYVFAGSGGTFSPQQKLTIPSGTNGDRFGVSVAIAGNTLIGGASEDGPLVGQTAYGAAYVFEFAGGAWTPQGKLTASDGAAFDRFGWSVAAGENVVAVGARGDDTSAGPDAGSVYLFTRKGSEWAEEQKIAPSDPFNGDRFGASVAFRQGDLIVGAAEKALAGPNGQGAAYFFSGAAVNKSRRTAFDYDGDGKADISVFRPANGQWWYQQSGDNSAKAITFGVSTDKPVPADYDGDGKTDIAVFRPAQGSWFIMKSSDGTFTTTSFGLSTDIPVPGDFDGDGKADIAIYRPSEGTWYVNKSSGGIQITQFGAAGDIPVSGDFDGDGKNDFAVFRQATGEWRIQLSQQSILVLKTFGLSTDKLVPADYTGDGKTDIAVWRPSNGTWMIMKSEDSTLVTIPFGAAGDIPAPADFDGDGKADVGVFRPAGANWFIQRSTSGIFILQFGASGDIPTPATVVR